MDVVFRSGFSSLFEYSIVYCVAGLQGCANVFSDEFAEACMEVG